MASASAPSPSPSTFATTLAAFCDELKQTFPELATPITRAATTTPAQFWTMWHRNLSILVSSDAKALFADRKGLLIGVVQMTPALWSEISEKTQGAIWRYLRTLVLESALENNLENIDPADSQKLRCGRNCRLFQPGPLFGAAGEPPCRAFVLEGATGQLKALQLDRDDI